MTPLTSRHNPWFMEIWQIYFNCRYDNSSYTGNMDLSNTSLPHCTEFEHQSLPPAVIDPYVVTTFDGFYAVAYALDLLIREKCPEKFADKTDIRSCIRGTELLDYIKKSDFQGGSWKVQFNDLGDVKGPYEFRQFYSSRTLKEKPISLWDQINQTLVIYEEEVDWSIFWDYDFANVSSNPPDSVCSRPCGPRLYYQHTELSCCWNCIACRNNERLNTERTGCVKCSYLSWPDKETATYCELIEPE